MARKRNAVPSLPGFIHQDSIEQAAPSAATTTAAKPDDHDLRVQLASLLQAQARTTHFIRFGGPGMPEAETQRKLEEINAAIAATRTQLEDARS